MWVNRSSNKHIIHCTSPNNIRNPGVTLYTRDVDAHKANLYCFVRSDPSINLFEHSNINTTNLIAILSNPFIYDEVYKLMGPCLNTNLYFTRYMSVQDKKALLEKSNIVLEEIKESIKNWTYSFEPLYIKTPNDEGSSKKEPVFVVQDKCKYLNPIYTINHKYLAVPSLKDILLQIAIKELIVSKCEKKIFNKQSFGFRCNRSTHDALTSVKGMVGITWIIESRINKFFYNIDSNILVNIIKNKLNPDRTLIGILHKLLKTGYLVNPYYYNDNIYMWKDINKVSSVLGGIISPILFNIYLTPFDEFIDKLKEKYARGPFHAKLYYVRFADEWVIGIKGDPNNQTDLIPKIQEQIRCFLWNELKLELDKNKLTHIGRECAKFLAHHIRLPLRDNTTLNNNHLYLYKSDFKNLKAPKVLIPLDDLKSKLIEKGFASSPDGRPKYVGKFLHLPDYDIVKNYNSFLKRVMVFYSMADNRSSLRELLYILEFSLAHTLAAKHRYTLKKVFKKYGKPVAVNTKNWGRIKFDRPNSLKAKHLNNIYKKFNIELERWKIKYRTKDPI